MKLMLRRYPQEKDSSLSQATAVCSALTALYPVRPSSKIKLVVLEAASCPLLALSGHRLVRCKCPLLGAKRTCGFALHIRL